MQLYGQELIKTNYHHIKFRDHRHSGSGDMVVLVCHVILQNHVIKGRSPHRQESIKVGYHPTKFDGHRDSNSGDI